MIWEAVGFSGCFLWCFAKRLACAGLAVDGHAALGQAVLEGFENFIAASVEPLEVLDAGELVLELGRDVGWFEIDGQDGLFALGGDHDLLDDVVGVGGVGGDHHDEDAALGYGLDDRLGPEGGGIDVAFIDPHCNADGTQTIDQRHDPLVVLTRITDKDLGTHCYGHLWQEIMQNGGGESKKIY